MPAAEINLKVTFAQARVIADLVMAEAKSAAQSVRYYQDRIDRAIEDGDTEPPYWESAERDKAVARLAELNLAVPLFGYDVVVVPPVDK